MNRKGQTRSVKMTLFWRFVDRKGKLLRVFRFSLWIKKRQAYRCFEAKSITSRLTPIVKIKRETQWRLGHVEQKEKEKTLLRKIVTSTAFLLDRKDVKFLSAGEHFQQEMSRTRWEFHVMERKFMRKETLKNDKSFSSACVNRFSRVLRALRRQKTKKNKYNRRQRWRLCHRSRTSVRYSLSRLPNHRSFVWWQPETICWMFYSITRPTPMLSIQTLIGFQLPNDSNPIFSVLFVAIRRSVNPPIVLMIHRSFVLGYNFDAVSCESCKAFFRRNALRPSVRASLLDNHRRRS